MHQDAASWWMCLMLKDEFGDKMRTRSTMRTRTRKCMVTKARTEDAV